MTSLVIDNEQWTGGTNGVPEEYADRLAPVATLEQPAEFAPESPAESAPEPPAEAALEQPAESLLEQPADPPAEPPSEVAVEAPMCTATTRKGQPCRNRTLPGYAYCRVHSPLVTNGVHADGVTPPAAPDLEAAEIPVQQTGAGEAEIPVRQVAEPAVEALPLRTTQAQAADAAYEMEVEVRNHVAAGATSTKALIGDVAAGVLHLIGQNMERMTPPQVRAALDMLRGVNIKDYLDPDFWKGIGMVLNYQINEQVSFVKRRMRGEYETDAFGMDRELIEVVRPFMTFMYGTWWRTTTEGLEYVPDASRALLVANHSGVLPWDGAMIATAVLEEHASARLVRNLYQDWFNTLPFVASALSSIGQVPGVPENAVRLLEEDELVCVFPEGAKGVGKLYKDRYRLARFGRGGFVQAALRTGAPLVPVAVIGSEEIYPMLANIEPLAKMLRLPFFPVTPFFPWMGLLGAIPLPTRWSITFCPPISTEEYGPEAADDSLIVFMLSEQVRCTIQETVNAKLKERKSIF